MEAFDLVVVGAGMSIVKLLCVLHVLEKAAEIGGVWAKERLYPGLHTNNHFRT